MKRNIRPADFRRRAKSTSFEELSRTAKLLFLALQAASADFHVVGVVVKR